MPNAVEQQPVIDHSANSSQIVSSHYNAATRQMTVNFRYENSQYVYSDVSPQLYHEFTQAKSVGKFLHLYIKPHYKGVRTK